MFFFFLQNDLIKWKKKFLIKKGAQKYAVTNKYRSKHAHSLSPQRKLQIPDKLDM